MMRYRSPTRGDCPCGNWPSPSGDCKRPDYLSSDRADRHNPATTPHANATLTNLKFIGKPLYTWMIFSEAIPETAYISKQPQNNSQKARSFLDPTIYNVKIPNDNLYIPATQIYIDSVRRIKDNLSVTRVSGEIAGKSRRTHRYRGAAQETPHSLAWQTH